MKYISTSFFFSKARYLSVFSFLVLGSFLNIAQAVTITIGDTNVLSSVDSGNENLLIAQQTKLPQAATIQSLSFYVKKAAGNLRLGIYDSTGPNGGPGKKKAETVTFVPVVGWNKAHVVTPLSLPAGTYWLAYLPSSSSLSFATDFTSGTFKYYPYTYAVMPAVFSTSPISGRTHWSFYATLLAALDRVRPTIPGNLTARPLSSFQVNLSWMASTDNVGVAGYKIFRNGIQVAMYTGTAYLDSGLTANTTYSYSVSAYDAAGNTSARSFSVSVTTPKNVPVPGVAYPLKPSSNNRYLVDQNNVPFMVLGDAPQSLIGNLSEAEAAFYFADRKAKGFNAEWINLLCADYTACASDGTTYDGIKPFTTGSSPANYDLSTPNPAYFQRIDVMLNTATKNGQVVFLDPIETGSWLTTLQYNGLAKARSYGQYLGNRYKNFPNILWMSGNDFQTWLNTSDDLLVREVALGIKDKDSKHIHTVELDYPESGSLDDSLWTTIIGFDVAYTYYPTYNRVLTEYNRGNFKPVLMVEAHYENEAVGGCCGESGTPQVLRRQEYWTQLSGAAGQLYGNYYTWRFVNGWKTSANLDTVGVRQLGYFKRLFNGRAWYNLVPDQIHAVVTAGFGTYKTSGPLATNTYATTARTPDGKLVISYLPNKNSVTVNMTKLSGTVTARWYDPTNGVFTSVSGSPFANSGTHQFTPTGNNSTGDTDWVLVLEAAPGS